MGDIQIVFLCLHFLASILNVNHTLITRYTNYLHIIIQQLSIENFAECFCNLPPKLVVCIFTNGHGFEYTLYVTRMSTCFRVFSLAMMYKTRFYRENRTEMWMYKLNTAYCSIAFSENSYIILRLNTRINFNNLMVWPFMPWFLTDTPLVVLHSFIHMILYESKESANDARARQVARF